MLVPGTPEKTYRLSSLVSDALSFLFTATTWGFGYKLVTGVLAS